MSKELTPKEQAEIGEVLEIVQSEGIKIGSKGWSSEYSMKLGKLGGRPAVQFDDLAKEIENYMTEYEKLGHVAPSVYGLCDYLGVADNTLRSIVTKAPEEEKKRLMRCLSTLKSKRRADLTNKALKGEVKERFTMFLLNVEHEMIEKKEVKNTHEGTINIKEALSGAKKEVKESNVIDLEPVDDY